MAVLFRARALWDFVTDREDEMSFTEGQVLEVVDATDEHWWEARGPDGKPALIPANRVERIAEEEKAASAPAAPVTAGGAQAAAASSAHATAAAAHVQQQPAARLSQRRVPAAQEQAPQGVLVQAATCVQGSDGTPDATYRIHVLRNGEDVEAERTLREFFALCGELAKAIPQLGMSAHDLSEDWQLRLSSACSRVPINGTNIAELLQELTAHQALSDLMLAWLFPDESKSEGDAGEEYVVTHDWSSDNIGDLELTEGETIMVTKQNAHGWWYGHGSGGKKGYFPRNYVRSTVEGRQSPTAGPPSQAQAQARPTAGVGGAASKASAGAANVMATLGTSAGAVPLGGHRPVAHQQSAAQSALQQAQLQQQLQATAVQQAQHSLGSLPMAGGGGANRAMSFRSLDTFDALMNSGVAVEMLQEAPRGAAIVQEGMRVVIQCCAMTWDGANTTTLPFVDTAAAGEPLAFSVGSRQVTEGLEHGIKQLAVGCSARITVTPQMAYGDAGNPPDVPPHSHVVYEIQVLSADIQPSQAATGPAKLRGTGVSSRNSGGSSYSGRVSRRVMLDTSGGGGGAGTSKADNDALLAAAAQTLGLQDSGAAGGGGGAGRISMRGKGMPAISELQSMINQHSPSAGSPSAAAVAASAQARSPGGRPALDVHSPHAAAPTPFSTPTGNDKVPPGSRSQFNLDPASAADSSPTALSGAGGGVVIVPYDQLLAPPFPAGVDSANREQHLSDQEFQDYFDMSKDTFNGLPGWKKQNMKRKLNLF